MFVGGQQSVSVIPSDGIAEMSSAATNSGAGEGGEWGWGDTKAQPWGDWEKTTGGEDGESFKMGNRQIVKAGMEKK